MKDKDEGVGEGKWIEFAVAPDRKMKAEIRKVPLKKLKLDPRNVRFHHLPASRSAQWGRPLSWPGFTTPGWTHCWCS